MINIENLTKFYGDLCAVDQVSLDIRKGEILGLLGPNGAGKTTMLRMLTGYLAPSSGTIFVEGLNIKDHCLEIKKIMGYLPDPAPLYQDMLTYDYLNFVADIRGLSGENKASRIKALADLCSLKDVMHQPIGELSKGYKQRVGMAHALMDDPEILVLDEPTSGLDPNQIIEIREIIKQIGKKKTIIFSTHILSEAEATCDRIVIINKGKIVADQKTEEIRHSVNGEKIINISLKNAEYQNTLNVLSSITGVQDVSCESEEDGILNIRLHCKSPKDIREDIYKRVKDTDWILLEMHHKTRNLEHMFRELTKEN